MLFQDRVVPRHCSHITQMSLPLSKRRVWVTAPLPLSTCEWLGLFLKRQRCAEPLIHWKWAIHMENFILKIRNFIRLPTANILHQLSQHTNKSIKFCLPWHISCPFKASRFISISSFPSLCILLAESCKEVHTLNRTQNLSRWHFTNHCTNTMWSNTEFSSITK